MKHTKQILAGLVLLSLSTSAFAAESAATPTATGATATAAAATPGDALNVPGAPSVVSQTATSVTLQWPKVAAAKTYVVKYSKSSVAQAFAKGDKMAAYEMETDQVTSTGTTISSLKTDTSYYFSVVALDAANNESTTNSEELTVKLVSTDAAAATGATVATATGTTATGATAPAASSLKLTAVNVVNDKTITVDFSAALSATPVTVKLTKSADTSSVAVASVTADPAMPNRVTVALATALSPSSSYSIVVIDAADQKGLPIAEGVNAVKEFATAATLAKAAGAEVALNAAPAVATVSGAAVPAGNLPATGTQENLILLVAALLAVGIMYGIQKKRA